MLCHTGGRKTSKLANVTYEVIADWREPMQRAVRVDPGGERQVEIA